MDLIEKNIDHKCINCSNEINDEYWFICEECSDVKFCKTCRGIGKSIHEHKLKKFYPEVVEETEVDPKEKIKSLIEISMPTVPDKIIDKKITTKFHYVKVDKDDYELTDEMLLLLDDKTINKYIPLRRLAPYKEKKELPQWKKKQVFKELQKELERRKVKML